MCAIVIASPASLGGLGNTRALVSLMTAAVSPLRARIEAFSLIFNQEACHVGCQLLGEDFRANAFGDRAACTSPLLGRLLLASADRQRGAGCSFCRAE